MNTDQQRKNMLKRILITGATDGIGRQVAFELASLGHEIIIHGKDAGKVDQIVKNINSRSGKGFADGVVADFSSLSQINNMVDEIYGKYDYLDVLINNAGIYMQQYELSVDNYEMTFAVNHLAAFALSLKLLQLIKRSNQGRVISVASAAHESSPKICFENLQQKSHYSAYDTYAQSKLCNVLFCYELHERLKNTAVTSNCLHPGVVDTKLLRAAFNIRGASLEEGAENSVYLADARELENISGKYFVGKQIRKSSVYSYDVTVREKLWKLSEKLTGTSY